MADRTSDRTQDKTSSVSFRLTKSTVKRRGGAPLLETENEKKEYLLSVEDKELNSTVPKPAPREYIIPLIKNNVWRLPGRDREVGVAKQTITTPTSSADKSNGSVATPPDEEKQKDIDQLAAAAILEDVKLGMFFEKREVGGEGGSGLVIPLLMQNKPPVDVEENKLNDLPFRPQETENDYSSVPIEHFGSAMLRGMGWKPGQTVELNKKGLIDPIEYIPHPGGLGLGATPKPPDPKTKKRIKKPGEIEIKRPKPYKDKDGRVRHMKKIGEEIPEERPEGFCMGNFARVIDGPHEDLYGKILAVDDKNSTIILRLAINNETLRFSKNHLEVVSEGEYERYGLTSHVRRQAESSEKEYGLILSGSSSSSLTRKRQAPPPPPPHDREHDDDSQGKYKKHKQSKRRDEDEMEVTSEPNDDHHTKRKKAKKEKRDRETSKRERDSDKKDRSRRDKDGSSKRETDIGRGGDDNSKKAGNSSKKSRTLPESRSIWVSSNLRVRVIDKEFHGGKHYNRKVEIIDVVDVDNCVCRTDEGRLLEGVSQRMLETVIPKAKSGLTKGDEAVVMIVSGEKKGELASIIQRDGSNCQALVRVTHSDDLLALEYDEICEYVGDITDR